MCANLKLHCSERKRLPSISGKEIVVSLELSSNISQKELWNFEEELKLIKGVEVDLREPKSLASVTTMIIQIVTDGSQMLGGVVGAAAAIRDVAKVVQKFIHAKDKDKENRDKEEKPGASRSKVVIIKKGKRIELYNLTTEEIEQILDNN